MYRYKSPGVQRQQQQQMYPMVMRGYNDNYGQMMDYGQQQYGMPQAAYSNSNQARSYGGMMNYYPPMNTTGMYSKMMEDMYRQPRGYSMRPRSYSAGMSPRDGSMYRRQMYQDGKVPQMTTAAAAADDYAGMESGYGGSGTEYADGRMGSQGSAGSAAEPMRSSYASYRPMDYGYGPSMDGQRRSRTVVRYDPQMMYNNEYEQNYPKMYGMGSAGDGEYGREMRKSRIDGMGRTADPMYSNSNERGGNYYTERSPQKAMAMDGAKYAQMDYSTMQMPMRGYSSEYANRMGQGTYPPMYKANRMYSPADMYQRMRSYSPMAMYQRQRPRSYSAGMYQYNRPEDMYSRQGRQQMYQMPNMYQGMYNNMPYAMPMMYNNNNRYQDYSGMYRMPQMMAQRPQTLKDNINMSTFPDQYELFMNKFREEFDAHRIRQLERIAYQGGSIQSNDALEYQEYMRLMQMLEYMPPRQMEMYSAMFQSFQKAVAQLNANLRTFLTQHCLTETMQLQQQKQKCQCPTSELLMYFTTNRLEMGKIGTAFHAEASEKDDKKEMPPRLHQLVLAAKRFMAAAMSEGAEGSYLNLFSFMESARFPPYETAWVPLWNIFELSKLQSAKMDQMIGDALVKEHFDNEPKGDGKKQKTAVIIGAGSNGLYAALRLFLAGTRVTVVNMYKEFYMRNQFFFLDPKWVCQLRYFLGTKFDELFGPCGNGFGRVNRGHVGQVNARNFEQALKERIVSLANIVENSALLPNGKENAINSDGCRLQLKFERYVERLELPNRAIVRPSPRNGDGTKFDEEMAEKALLSNGTENTENNKQMAQMPSQQMAQNGGDSGKNGDAEMRESLPFDMLICAGGANDRIRDEYLGKPVQLSYAKSYGVVVFNKPKEYTIVEDGTALLRMQMDALWPFLKEQKMDELVAGCTWLPTAFRQKYAQLTQLIVYGMAGGGYGGNEGMMYNNYGYDYGQQMYNSNYGQHGYGRRMSYEQMALPHEFNGTLTPGNGGQRLTLRLFENEISLQMMVIETPRALAQFFNELDWLQRRGQMYEGRRQKYEDFRTLLNRKWFAALFYYALANLHPQKLGHYMVKGYSSCLDVYGNACTRDYEKSAMAEVCFDQYRVNAATFNVVVNAVTNPVQKVPSAHRSHSTILMAVGDANASPHFLTASGLSTGRLGIERIAKAIGEYNRSGEMDEYKLMTKLNYSLRMQQEATMYQAIVGNRLVEGIYPYQQQQQQMPSPY